MCSSTGEPSVLVDGGQSQERGAEGTAPPLTRRGQRPGLLLPSPLHLPSPSSSSLLLSSLPSSFLLPPPFSLLPPLLFLLFSPSLLSLLPCSSYLPCSYGRRGHGRDGRDTAAAAGNGRPAPASHLWANEARGPGRGELPGWGTAGGWGRGAPGDGGGRGGRGRRRARSRARPAEGAGARGREGRAGTRQNKFAECLGLALDKISF